MVEKRVGRKKKYNPEIIAKALYLINYKGLTLQETAKKLGLSRVTLYRALKELEENEDLKLQVYEILAELQEGVKYLIDWDKFNELCSKLTELDINEKMELIKEVTWCRQIQLYILNRLTPDNVQSVKNTLSIMERVWKMGGKGNPEEWSEERILALVQHIKSLRSKYCEGYVKKHLVCLRLMLPESKKNLVFTGGFKFASKPIPPISLEDFIKWLNDRKNEIPNSWTYTTVNGNKFTILEKLIIATKISTNERTKTFLSMKWKQLDLKSGIAYFYEKKTKTEWRSRLNWLIDGELISYRGMSLSQWLAKYKEHVKPESDEQVVFDISEETLRKIFRKFGKYFGIEHLVPHHACKLFMLYNVLLGYDITVIVKGLNGRGWADMNTAMSHYFEVVRYLGSFFDMRAKITKKILLGYQVTEEERQLAFKPALRFV